MNHNMIMGFNFDGSVTFYHPSFLMFGIALLIIGVLCAFLGGYIVWHWSLKP